MGRRMLCQIPGKLRCYAEPPPEDLHADALGRKHLSFEFALEIDPGCTCGDLRDWIQENLKDGPKFLSVAARRLYSTTVAALSHQSLRYVEVGERPDWADLLIALSKGDGSDG